MIAWRKIEEFGTPKDGDQIWGYLFDTGIRLLEWQSAESAASEFGGSPEHYEGEWCVPDDHVESWKPQWWIPVDAIPLLPPM